MKRHSEASSAASIKRQVGRPSPKLTLLLAIAALALAGTFATLALADTAPSVAISPASSVSYTTAHLQGTVNPNGGPSETFWQLQYSHDPETEGWSTAVGGQFSGSEAEEATPLGVSANLTGLSPATEYKIRIVASNSGGEATTTGASFTTEAIPTPTVLIDTPTAVTASSAHFSGEINPGGTDPAFEVSWHFQCNPDCPGLEGALLPGNASEPVEADATNLKPGTAYEVSLTAKNAGEPTSAGPETFTTLAIAPQISELDSVALLTEATLTADLNPGGAQTTYHFEYGTTASYGSSTPAVVLPAGSAALPVSASLSGLIPGATYHYTLVATNSVETVLSADRTFTTGTTPVAQSCPNEGLRVLQSATFLQDCRAYELVSPPHKFGGQIGSSAPSVAAQIAADGEHVAYHNNGYALEGSKSGSESGFLASRGLSWSNASVLPVPGQNQPGLGIPGYDAYLRGSTPDGRTSVYFDNTTSPHGSLWVYRADGSRVRIADASVSAFGNNPAPLIGALPHQPWFEGISANGKHVVFGDTDALVPGVSETGNEILYVWNDDDSNGGLGSLDVVNRTSSSTLTVIEPGASATLGGSAQHTTVDDDDGGLRNAISADGSRVFFQTPPPVDSGQELPNGGGPLYMRENGSTTTEISAPTPGYTPTSPPTRVQYLDASEDGRYAFFWADGDIVEGAPAAGGIYRYDAETSSLGFLATAVELFAQVPTAMASADGSHLYYQDGNTVKVYGGGQSTTTVFNGVVQDSKSVPTVSIRDDICATAGVSSDGRFFAFSARAGSDSALPLQVYRYDAVTGALDRVSTSPTAPTTYNAGWYAAPSCESIGFPNRVRVRLLSDDGHYVFFDTEAALVPADSNGVADTYQWHDGKVSLISSGTNGFIGSGSNFIGTGASGRDAFFTTTDPLVYQDPDTAYDIYDARVDGGLASQTEGPPARCSGEGCQSDSSAPPPLAATASASYAGPANAKPRRHAKKKKKQKHHQAKHRVNEHQRRDNTDRRASR